MSQTLMLSAVRIYKTFATTKISINISINLIMTEYRTYKKEQFCIPKRYVINKTLGAGSYGTVCLVFDSKSTSSKPVELAVKKVARIFNKPVLMKRAIREFRLMNFFRGHRHVCSSRPSLF